MSWKFAKHSSPKSKKNHQCDCCGKIIPPGFQYYRIDGNCEGDMVSVKVHEECQLKLNELSKNLVYGDEVTYSDFYELFHEFEQSNVESFDVMIKEKYKKPAEISKIDRQA